MEILRFYIYCPAGVSIQETPLFEWAKRAENLPYVFIFEDNGRSPFRPLTWEEINDKEFTPIVGIVDGSDRSPLENYIEFYPGRFKELGIKKEKILNSPDSLTDEEKDKIVTWFNNIYLGDESWYNLHRTYKVVEAIMERFDEWEISVR
jgi:hypothetical protein